MIDELSLGLMPKIIDQCYTALLKLLRDEGMTVLLVEQNTERALSVADDVCVLESGQYGLERLCCRRPQRPLSDRGLPGPALVSIFIYSTFR
jgi:energy-coupling factor transporter ATP-binding protein EcfA2